MNPWSRPLKWHLQQFAILVGGSVVGAIPASLAATVLQIYGGYSRSVCMAGGLCILLPLLAAWHGYWYRRKLI